MGNEMVMQPAVMRNGGSTFGADSIDRGRWTHNGAREKIHCGRGGGRNEGTDVCASR